MKKLYFDIKNDKGVSLIELVVVIAIIAILAVGGGFGLNMLLGSEAKQVARKMDAEISDARTGAMARAGETLVIRYIQAPSKPGIGEAPSASYEEMSKKGVEKSGYYAIKVYKTIRHKDPASSTPDPKEILYELSDFNDREYRYLGHKRVECFINDDTLKLAEDQCIQIEYSRGNGLIKSVKLGTVAVGAPEDTGSYAAGSAITLNKLIFKCGLSEYTISFDDITGRNTLE